MTDSRNSRSFLEAIRRDVRRREVASLAVVPAVMLAVSLLPVPVKRSFAFSYVDPSPITAVTAHYVHLSQGHLLANVLGYLVLVTIGYLLAVLAGRRRMFTVSLVVYLLAFPPILSTLNLVVPREAIMYGFSGVNMAIAGLLPLLLTTYVGRRLLGPVRGRDAPALFFLVMALVAVIAIPRQPVTLLVAIGSGLAALAYAADLYERFHDSPDGDRGASIGDGSTRGWLELAVVGGIIAVGYPLIGFPSDPSGAGLVVNVYVHALGYSLAFIVPYVAFELGVLADPAKKGFSQ